MRETLSLTFLAPVAVGRTVCVHVYRRAKAESSAWSWFLGSQGPPEVLMIEDRVTGIRYCSEWLSALEHQGGDRAVYIDAVPESYVLDTSYEAHVLACKVVSRMGNARNHQINTVITLEHEA